MGAEALAQVLRPLSSLFKAEDYPDLLVGLEMPDDAAVYRLDAEQAIIATADFFTPVVDDAYIYGAIAAANALSDIYAMGGRPLFALNLAAFPTELPPDVISEILRGGAEKVREAGALIAGGHTVTAGEPLYGLAVIGRIHPDRIFTKSGARAGDLLVLTKPLGSGVITTTHKSGRLPEADLAAATAVMLQLNRTAAEKAQAVGVHAVTDITGFGLAGHAHEMAAASGVDLEFDYAALPWLNGARRWASEWLFPGGAERNTDYFGSQVRFEGKLSDWEQHLVYDPQTSGGLLIAAAPSAAEELIARLRIHGEQAWIVGKVVTGNGKLIFRG